MSARATFGQWLRATRLEHGLSQEALAHQTGMSRTQIVNTERTPTWPLPRTRERLHAVFGTSDEDLVAFGAATRTVHQPAGKPARVTYEPTVRRGEAMPTTVAPALETVPPAIAEMLAEIRWTDETRESVAMLLEGVLGRQRRLSDAAAEGAPDTPRPAPQRTPERT